VLHPVTPDDVRVTDLDVTRARELAAEAVDPARSTLSRILCAEEVPRRLRRDNPAAAAADVAQAAAALLYDAKA